MNEAEFEENRDGWEVMLLANPLARAMGEPQLHFEEEDPIWFRNFMYFVPQADSQGRLYTIFWFQPAIHRWLDETNVKNYPRREAIVCWAEAAYSSIADLSKLRDPEDPWEVHRTWKRLKGLCP